MLDGPVSERELLLGVEDDWPAGRISARSTHLFVTLHRSLIHTDTSISLFALLRRVRGLVVGSPAR